MCYTIQPCSFEKELKRPSLLSSRIKTYQNEKKSAGLAFEGRPYVLHRPLSCSCSLKEIDSAMSVSVKGRTETAKLRRETYGGRVGLCHTECRVVTVKGKMDGAIQRRRGRWINR